MSDRVLWKGSPDPDHFVRRWRRQQFQAFGSQVLFPALGFALTMGFLAGFSMVGVAMPYLLLILAAWWGAPFAWQALRIRQRAAEQSYVLTEDRLLIATAGDRLELRLANLPDISVDPDGDGFGTISFRRPTGAGPERYLRRVADLAPQVRPRTTLMVAIPEADRVARLILDAQAASAAKIPVAEPIPDGASTPSVQADSPIARPGLTASMAVVPWWFGTVFLVIGLGTAWVGLSAPGAGAPWAIVAIGLFFAGIGGLFLRAWLVARAAASRLRVGGVTVPGRVVDVAATGVQVNDVEQWVVRYTFRVMGVDHPGQSPLMSYGEAARHAAGDAISIRYDPADPSRSLPVDEL